MMSIPGAAAYEVESSEEYQVSSSMVHSSGFLSPPPYNMEIRRDSVASSQSSMSSFASGMSDYSLPVTPTCGQSPMADENFVDMIAYDFGQDFHNQSLHGLPIRQQPKVSEQDQSLYNSWQMIPHTIGSNDGHQSQFRPQIILPATGGFLQTDMAEDTGLEPALVSTADSSWSSLSTAVHPGISRPWGSRDLDHIMPEENLQALWTSQIQQSQGVHLQQIIPSDTMAELDSEYVHVEQEHFTDSNTFDANVQSFPQSPQEVAFKKETSPIVKHESDSEDYSPRLTRSIYVSPTGGKSVKKERRSCMSSKKRVKVVKNRDRNQTTFFGKRIDAKLDGVELQFGEGGAMQWVNTRPSGEKQRCEYIDDSGHQCTKHFVRPEHLKRHQATHSGERHFHCTICMKEFNRNDNCQEHYWTHVRRPGKKDGRNTKMSLAEVEQHCMDPINGPKLIEKLRQKWKCEVEVQVKAKL